MTPMQIFLHNAILPPPPPPSDYRKDCPVCGEEFLASNSDQKTCSIDCSRKQRGLPPLVEAKTRERGVMQNPQACKVCGKAFVRKTATQKCCSLKCMKVNWLESKRRYKEKLKVTK